MKTTKWMLAAAMLFTCGCKVGMRMPAGTMQGSGEAAGSGDAAQHEPVGALPVAAPLASGLNEPRGLALDSQAVYCATHGDKSVVSIPKAGGPPKKLVTAQWQPDLVAQDDANVYFTSWLDESTDFRWRLEKVSKAGGKATDLGTYPSLTSGLVVDATHIYWLDGQRGGVTRMPKGGGDPQNIAAGYQEPKAIALDEGNVYFVAEERGSGSPTVLKVAKTGGDLTVLAAKTNSRVVGLDQTHAYFFKRGGPNNAAMLWKVPKGGGEAAPVGECPFAFRMVIAGPHAYLVDPRPDSLTRCPLEGGPKQPLAKLESGQAFVAADDQFVYWSDTKGGSVMKAAR